MLLRRRAIQVVFWNPPYAGGPNGLVAPVRQVVPAKWVSFECVTCAAPRAPHGGLVRVEVTLNGGEFWSSSGATYAFYRRPSLHAVLPAAGSCAGGGELVLSGMGLRIPSALLVVRFRDVLAPEDAALAAVTSATADGADGGWCGGDFFGHEATVPATVCGRKVSSVRRQSLDPTDTYCDPTDTPPAARRNAKPQQPSLERLWHGYCTEVGLLPVPQPSPGLGPPRAGSLVVGGGGSADPTKVRGRKPPSRKGSSGAREPGEQGAAAAAKVRKVRLTPDQSEQRVRTWLAARETVVTKAFEHVAPKFYEMLEAGKPVGF